MTQLQRQIPDGAISPGYNGSGSTIVAKRFVRRSGATADQVALPAAASNAILGVTLHDIEDLTRGDIQTGGLAIVTCSAAITAGGAVEVTTAGKAAPFSSGTKVGIANTTTTDADQDIEIYLETPASAVS